jgi:hypothetical protein
VSSHSSITRPERHRHGLFARAAKCRADEYNESATRRGVAVLFFEALIAGGSLQPSDTSKSAVSMVPTPVEVEFGHLQKDTAFLSLANVPPDTYNSLNLTLGNAVLTIGGAPRKVSNGSGDDVVKDWILVWKLYRLAYLKSAIRASCSLNPLSASSFEINYLAGNQ